MATRRGVIGGGLAAALLAGLGYRAWDRGLLGGLGAAYKPWSDWDGHAADGIRRPLHAGILAANPHDSQPWAFTAERDILTLYADRSRHLGSFDPYRREMHLALGCCTQNIVLAAAAHGLAATVTALAGRLTLDPGDAPVAAVRIGLAPAAPVRHALYRAIPQRHTNRYAYRPDQPLEASLLALLRACAEPGVQIALIAEKAARADLAALMISATQAIIADPQMPADSARWVRTGRAAILDHRDGITLDTAGLSETVLIAGKLLPDMGTAVDDAAWLASTKDTQLPSAPVLGLMFVRDRFDAAQAIAAGRSWQRLHLAATAHGLAAQPINQPVEIADRNLMLGKPDAAMPALRALARAQGWDATFAFRLGYSDYPAKPSPRRPLSSALRD